MKLTVGPVIGKVTDTAARVLVEVDQGGELKGRLRSSTGAVIEASVSLPANRPRVLKFGGLQPDTAYSLELEGAALPVECGFRTFTTEPVGLNVGVVSCNFTTQRGSSDLWKKLWELWVAPNDLGLLLHVGDQIYGDAAYGKALKILGDRTSPTKTQAEQILETYRWLYRWTWAGHPATRQVLARIPNLTIWDDHEIRDDWGSRRDDGVPGTQNFAIGTLARRVYREYQRQLWDDFDPDSDAPDGFEDHIHRFGKIGVWFLDLRGGRSFARDPARPYLGTDQWKRIDSNLEGGGLDDLRALVVVSSVPLAYMGDTLTDIGKHVVDDLQDHWAWGDNQKEQIEFLRGLRNWKAGSEGREILVVAGDVHIGGHTSIRHEDDEFVRQLISSPITNKPPGFFAFHGLQAFLEGEETLGSSYSFEHDRLTNSRNFGIVVIRIPDQGRPKMDPSLVTE